MQPVDLSALELDWELARKRFERDVRDDFFPDPFRNRDVFVAAKARFDEVVPLDHYVPEGAESWDVPKANFCLRHSINVAAVDRLVYQALVDRLAAICDPKFSGRSYAFRLRAADAAEMYFGFVRQKGAFDTAIRERLTTDPNAIVVTVDVAQYFENISFDILKHKLIELTEAKLGHPVRSLIDVLIQCLCHWSPYTNRGLPQNMFPSSFLGNVYLHSFDGAMHAAGFDCHRYMDDVRIVAPDEATARRALKLAITHLRALELSVNGKKTGLVRPNTDEWRALAAPPDQSLADIECAVRSGNPALLPDCVTQLNDMLRSLIEDGGRERTRLRFVLGRLTSLRRLRTLDVPEPSDFGARLLELLKWLPEETTYVCEYFHAGTCTEPVLRMLERMLTDETVCIYGWQNYHMWLLAAEKTVGNPSLLAKARSVLAQSTEQPEIAGAALYLGSQADAEDLSLLSQLLASATLPITVRRALCIAVQQLEENERRPLLDRLATTSASLAVLIHYLRKLPVPRYVARPRRISLRRLPDELPDNFSPN